MTQAETSTFSVDPGTGLRTDLAEEPSPEPNPERVLPTAGDRCVVCERGHRRGSTVMVVSTQEKRWACKVEETGGEITVAPADLLHAHGLPQARRLVRVFDADGDGVLSPDELAVMVRALFGHAATSPRGEIFSALAADLGCSERGIDPLGVLQLYELPEHFAFGLLEQHTVVIRTKYTVCPSVRISGEGWGTEEEAAGMSAVLSGVFETLWCAAARPTVAFGSVAVSWEPAEGGEGRRRRTLPRVVCTDRISVVDTDGDKSSLAPSQQGGTVWLSAERTMHDGEVTWDAKAGTLHGGGWRATVADDAVADELTAASVLTLALKRKAGAAPQCSVAARQFAGAVCRAVLHIRPGMAGPLGSAFMDAVTAFTLNRTADRADQGSFPRWPTGDESSPAALRRASRKLTERCTQRRAPVQVHRAAVAELLSCLQSAFCSREPLGSLPYLVQASEEQKGAAEALWRWRELCSVEGSDLSLKHSADVGNTVGVLTAVGICSAEGREAAGEDGGSSSSA
eukprot:TRINITY_DN30765_c0_g1_i1.p1 TRINITY_DN30765_c0_g1~~TRINITY_DN30765_c0_g1_i1.p1  ORF type:complete len:513 (+),score=160.49 TRINITY_DN30765_c0_g1_i1:50-1588(+)